jgi:hypothetical protein
MVWRSDRLPRIVAGKVMTPADLRRLHKYMLEIEKVAVISDEMRAVIEREWPELAHKLPPKASSWPVPESARGRTGRRPTRVRLMWQVSGVSLDAGFLSSSRARLRPLATHFSVSGGVRGSQKSFSIAGFSSVRRVLPKWDADACYSAANRNYRDGQG